MKLGIVGSEQAKFTDITEAYARVWIHALLWEKQPELVISGHSPLGGVDWYAIEEAKKLDIPTKEFAPARMQWAGGYRERNLQIAQASDVVICITLKTLPDSYRGMRFEHGCYHCHTPPEHHVKSGGCWTMREAAKLGKATYLKVIDL